MHVVEHLPLDLQIRLVFEARRVLAQGGLLDPGDAQRAQHPHRGHQLLARPHPRAAGAPAVPAVPGHRRRASPRPSCCRCTRSSPPLPDGDSPELVAALTELILGAGDIALVAHR